MLRVALQERELLCRVFPDLGWKRTVGAPESPGGTMGHIAPLKGPGISGLIVGDSAFYKLIQPPGFKIGLNPGIDRLGLMVIEPSIEFLDLLRRQRLNGAFDFLYGVQAHQPSLYEPGVV